MITIPLDNQSKYPLYEQIYAHLKQEMKAGKLKPGVKLPSSRLLSNHLLVSRTTVDLAYHQLLSEGYIESKPRSGFYVCNLGDLFTIEKIQKPVSIMSIKKQSKYPYDFSPFGVDLSGFPHHTWKKLLVQCMNEWDKELFQLGENQGDLGLRISISRYLHESRGVTCQPERIILGAGTGYLLQVLSLLFDRDYKIAVENPVYLRVYQILTGMGFSVEAVEMDAFGIQTKQLSERDVNVVYVTPSHQYPLGIVMPMKRRLELLSFAYAKENTYIIEDDHDSEFRYHGKPIPALWGSDTKERVIYMGTFSRVIAPSIRVGYMILPECLYKRYLERCSYLSSTVSRIDQAILQAFLDGGYFERHLNKMRKLYRNRHDCLLRALKIFGQKIRVTGENAGLYLVVEFRCKIAEEELLQKAKEEGILLYGLNQYYLNQKRTLYPTVLLGFAHLEEAQLEEGVLKLYHIFACYLK